jgi:hypothetical protein
VIIWILSNIAVFFLQIPVLILSDDEEERTCVQNIVVQKNTGIMDTVQYINNIFIHHRQKSLDLDKVIALGVLEDLTDSLTVSASSMTSVIS